MSQELSPQVGSHQLDKKQLIFWLITVAVPIAVLLIPESQTYTHAIKVFFAITIGMILIVAFETLPILIPSLMLPVCYGLAGLAPMGAIFGPWSSSMPWLFIAGMIIANVFDHSGLMKRLTYRCILLVGGSYKGMLYGIAVTGIIMGICIPNIGGRGALYAALAFGLCKALSLKPQGKAAGSVMLAAAVAATMPAYMFLTDLGIVGLNAAANFAQVSMLSWLKWFLYVGPPLLAWLFFSIWLITKLFKPEEMLESKAFFEKELAALGKWQPKEIKMAILMLVVLVLLLTTGWHKMDVGWIFLFAACICFLPGIRLAGEEDLKINYGMVIFVVATMSIGVVSNVVGAGNYLAEIFYPLVEKTGSIVFIGAIWVVAFLVNFLLTPLAGISTLVGPLAHIGELMGIDPYVVIFTFMQGMDQVLLPYENVMMLLFMSFGMLSMRDFVKYFGIRAVIDLLFVLLILVPYWHLLGIFAL